jgi:hypothetical protein
MSSTALSDTSAQRTFGASYIVLPGGEPSIWPYFSDPLPSMFIYIPPPPSAAERAATWYAATLAIHDYDEAVREALMEGDDAEARNCLEVIRAIVDVALGLLNGASSKHSVLH